MFLLCPIWDTITVILARLGHLCGLVSSVLDHRSLPPEFESWHGHICRLFHLWLHFITFSGCSAHLAYHVHKSGHKKSMLNVQKHQLLFYLDIILYSYMTINVISKSIIMEQYTLFNTSLLLDAEKCMQGCNVSWKVTNSFSRYWKCPWILQNQEISWKNVACRRKIPFYKKKRTVT